MKKDPNKKTIVLLDSHAMLHRSYHAFPYLKTESGIPSGALFGMFQMILRVFDEFKPYAIIACFDLPGDTFRHTAFDGYKGTRSETDTDLVRQIELSYKLCEAWGIPIIQSPGFEADDCIGTLSEKLYHDGYHVVIASGDRDTLQLVRGDDVVVWTLKKTITDTIVFNEAGVNEYYGFGPTFVPDYKALAGDASDNIPGIRGIGDKTARLLVSRIGSIETIYECIEKDPEKILSIITKRMFELISAGREEADFSKILGTIRLDTPVTVPNIEKPLAETVSVTALSAFCREYGFNSLLTKVKKIFEGELDEKPVAPKKKPAQQGNSLFDGTGALSTETDEDSESDPEKPVAVHDDDLRELQIMRWILDPRVSLASELELLYWASVENRKDLRKFLEAELESAKLKKLWDECEKPLVMIVKKMSENGILLDTVLLSLIQKRVAELIQKCEDEIIAIAGKSFNIQSPKQLGEILFTHLSLQTKGIKKNKSGGYSTQESELEKIRESHPIVDLVLQHRGLSKLQNTYIDALPNHIGTDGRLHPVFLQDGTSTGRFSCTNPNIQNIPIKGDIATEIRTAFVAAKGNTLVRFDYSQIELRIASLLAGELTMQKLFRQGVDIHTGVAAKMFGITPDLVTKDMRRKAKTINFGILYGMGIAALANDMGTSRSEAEDFMDRYRLQFSALQPYFDECIATARINGYCTTLFGRRRYIPELQSINPGVRAYGERIAMNAPIQGTAADVMKFGMIQAQKLLGAEFPEVMMIAQVHDELLFEVPIDQVQKFAPKMKQVLQTVLDIYAPRYAAEVPLLVESETGPSWGQMKSL